MLIASSNSYHPGSAQRRNREITLPPQRMREMDEVSEHINPQCNLRVEPSETTSQPAVVHHER
jgi:hypothetical protein